MPDSSSKVKVFISWSGGLSKAIAHSLKLFLPRVIQSLDPWVSADDISKGTLWHGAIMQSLQEARFGIIVLTNDNVGKPWLHYETGYMTHYIQDDQKGLVSPLLVEVPTTALEGPMTSLQATNFAKEDVLQLISDINARLDQPLDKENLNYYFSNAWGAFEKEVKSDLAVHSEVTDEPQTFDTEKVLTQILDTVRELARDRREEVPARSSETNWTDLALITAGSQNLAALTDVQKLRLRRALRKTLLQGEMIDSAHAQLMLEELDGMTSLLNFDGTSKNRHDGGDQADGT